MLTMDKYLQHLNEGFFTNCKKLKAELSDSQHRLDMVKIAHRNDPDSMVVQAAKDMHERLKTNYNKKC